MKMMDCPRWYSCSAPICPFWIGGIHRKDEPVCYYLREFYKENAEANFDDAGVGHIYEELKTTAPKVIAGSRLIRKEIEKSSKTNSRLAGTGQKKMLAGVDERKAKNGVYSAANLSVAGEGLTQGQHHPIPPLPDAGNGIPEAGLRGDRNRCPTCHEYFNSSKAFDQHRTGKYNGRRRCLTVGEMQSKNFGKTRDGFWLCAVLEKDAARLAAVRTGG